MLYPSVRRLETDPHHPAIYQIVSSKSLAEEGADVGKQFDPREGKNITLSQEGGKEEAKGCC
jgi:Ras-related protein Rab-11A